MSVATKIKSGSITVPKKAKVKVVKKPKTTWTLAEIQQQRKKEQDQRNEYKIDWLERYTTSEELFDALRSEINTLSTDESSHDLSVGNDYNYGVDYDIDILLELIRDLRDFTSYTKDEDDESITRFNLDYLRPYF